jgi:acetyltransferase-like isoleucine patch superfamily enzyme
VVVEGDVIISGVLKILKSTIIELESDVVASSVVVGYVEPFSIYAGIPARKICQINQSK